MANHTPAPWTVASDDDCLILGMGKYVETNGASYLPWHRWECGDNEDDEHSESWANACLIAAAPDMYDALQWIVDRYGDEEAAEEMDCARVARAALTKVEQEQVNG